MNCPYCNKKAPWIPNEEVYGKRYGKSFMCYWCKDCDAYVGCHNNTTTPLGTMANKELRRKRMAAHAVIDPIWKEGRMDRNAIYAALSEKLGRDVHVGSSDMAQCDEIISAAREIFAKP